MAKIRDFMSGLTHCVGAALSLAGLVFLIIFAAIKGDAFDVVSFTLFGSALLLKYLFSTLYHWLNLSEKSMRVFKKFNNIMTHFLIATSFTPICLGPLRGAWGWSIFGVVWGISVIGIVFSSIWAKVPKIITLIISIATGIVIFITLFPIVYTYKKANILYSLCFLVISAALYLSSTIINLLRLPKNTQKRFGVHDFSHILFMLRSAFQYYFILNYITIL